VSGNTEYRGGDEANVPACGGDMGIEVVLVVLAVVVLLIGGTVFSAWRAERTEDREDDPESLTDQP
jgi:hypothetical protein